MQFGDDAVVHIPAHVQPDVFEQPAVVGDQQQGAVVAFQGFLQLFDGSFWKTGSGIAFPSRDRACCACSACLLATSYLSPAAPSVLCTASVFGQELLLHVSLNVTKVVYLPLYRLSLAGPEEVVKLKLLFGFALYFLLHLLQR